MRLALQCGRIDWENLLEELTPRQVSVWQTLEVVEPWGERRADHRAAANTIMFLQSQVTEPLSPEAVQQIHGHLTNYLGLEEGETLTAEQAQAIVTQACQANKPQRSGNQLPSIDQWRSLATSLHT